MANIDKENDQVSQLSLPCQPHNDVVGCLLDVSGSMQGALEAGGVEEPASQRLQAALRAIMRVAKSEQRQRPGALFFVGLFGLDSKTNPGCPTQIDLCSVIEALVGVPCDHRSGHDLLVSLAKRHNRTHIENFIRTKLTDDEARFIYIHLHQNGRESRMEKFIASIAADETIDKWGNQVREAVTSASTTVASIFRGSTSIVHPSMRLQYQPVAGLTDRPPEPPTNPLSLLSLTAESIEITGTKVSATAGSLVDAAVHTKMRLEVDKSDALKLARDICNDWLKDFTTFIPRPTNEIIELLERFKERTNGNAGSGLDDVSKPQFLDTLRRYLYGMTPMKQSLNEAFKVFRQADQFTRGKHVLLLISDGMSTDGNPLTIFDEALHKSSNISVATVFLTDDRHAAQRRIYDKPLNAWENDGRVTLFRMASKVSAAAHPIPVLTTLGWQIPSSGEAALFAIVCSATALEEICSMMVSVRFESADVLLDVLGRWNLDEYVEYEHERTINTPSEQLGPTCYANAAAAVIYMALHRIVGRVEGYPTICDIRTRILARFPSYPPGFRFKDMLAVLMEGDRNPSTTNRWIGYRPLRIQEVDETGARNAVLRRRPVIATFFLSENGWKFFGSYFNKPENHKKILGHEHMNEYRSQLPFEEGHAVVLVRCSPDSLTFLNSWKQPWGDKGLFRISDPAVLENNDPSYRMRFYDIFWLKEDLADAERAAYDAKVEELLSNHLEEHPGITLIEARCPVCLQKASIAKFAGSIREAICPNCKAKFKPSSDHIRQAL
ncbi:hypothetical protein S7711_01623 [Stachybotrys chartarum IBT 7711]|uniref:VWFA domain-containing protein n=1 Tax=Stachybotrys chartarum (strain CBS 109288 / IBT 7711) TaxID=1280523 RepID=A0A084BCA0_STACB|nr:hypothetical protein S7711_01623 [Stachybotrys chartarum IBT 7711]